MTKKQKLEKNVKVLVKKMVIEIFLIVLVISLFFKFSILRYYGYIPRYGVLTFSLI